MSLNLVSTVLLLVGGITGIFTAWADGLMQFLPGAATVNHALWTLSGYLHSVFGFFYIAIILFIALTGFYHMIRYRIWRFRSLLNKMKSYLKTAKKRHWLLVLILFTFSCYLPYLIFGAYPFPKHNQCHSRRS
ncbi:MAG: hypothetical protein Ct9H300mP4_18120 [Gammaproteobacteria bacterium]|nr:MAG: hypothetical protein Ct9H300mP4_18120 [Gammaproteobacteria bacterium]